MKRWRGLLGVLSCLFAISPALAQKRVALVIGNGAYEHIGTLLNPASDANAMAALLRSVGFEVISGVDLKQKEMAEKLSQLSDVIGAGADVAVVFYAGRGMGIAGKNYLIPVDADPSSVESVMLTTVDADSVAVAASAAKVKLVLLDAGRENPFAKSDANARSAAPNAGLAALGSADGALIAFATSPGAAPMDGAGRHSPFTQALLDNLAAPGVEINDVMTRVRAEVRTATNKKQNPWVTTNLTDKFYVVAPASTPTESAK